MNKLTKAIKLVNGLTDEEKVEFAEFFKQEEDAKQEKQEIKTEVKEEKEEVKEEPKKETIDFETRFNQLLEVTQGLVNDVKDIKEKQPKMQSFGAKQKQGEGKEQNDFNTLFANLTRGQN